MNSDKEDTEMLPIQINGADAFLINAADMILSAKAQADLSSFEVSLAMISSPIFSSLKSGSSA